MLWQFKRLLVQFEGLLWQFERLVWHVEGLLGLFDFIDCCNSSDSHCLC